MVQLLLLPPVDERPWQFVTAAHEPARTYIASAPLSDSFAAPAETSASLRIATSDSPSMAAWLEAVEDATRSIVTTGTVTTIVVDGDDDDWTAVRRIESGAIFGDRTEISRTFKGGGELFSLINAAERTLSGAEQAAWIARLRATQPRLDDLERLQKEVETARQNAAARAVVREGREQLDVARKRIEMVDRSTSDLPWLDAVLAFGSLATDLPSLLRLDGIDGEELASLTSDGLRMLRAAMMPATRLDRTQFLPMYQRLAAAYLFDVGSTRAGSLQIAERAYQYLIDQLIASRALHERLVFMKACTLVAQSAYREEELMERATALSFPLIRGDEPASVEYCRTVHPAQQHLLPYSREPASLSLEAVLHRTLYDRFSTMRIAGPTDALGMANWSGFATGDNETSGEATRRLWKQSAERLMDESAIVLVLLWASDGVLWEIETLFGRYPRKCVLLMLPAAYVRDAGEAWEAARAALPLDIPPYRGEGAFILYGADGKVARELPFDSIWTATLSSELVSHAAAAPVA